MSQIDISKIQVPINNKVRRKAEKVAEDYGFSSVQEVIRLFLNDFAIGNIKLSFIKNTDEYITPEFEVYLNDQLKIAEEEIKNGTIRIAHSADDIKQAAKNLKDE